MYLIKMMKSTQFQSRVCGTITVELGMINQANNKGCLQPLKAYHELYLYHKRTDAFAEVRTLKKFRYRTCFWIPKDSGKNSCAKSLSLPPSPCRFAPGKKGGHSIGPAIFLATVPNANKNFVMTIVAIVLCVLYFAACSLGSVEPHLVKCCISDSRTFLEAIAYKFPIGHRCPEHVNV